jgi:peptidoglycan/LPS O-acetylase OafA/YrhL
MRLKAIDGWRGIACIIVAFHHLNAAHSFYFENWIRYASPLLELFFVISGFVISLAFADMVKNTRSFAAVVVRFAGRLWPLHLFSLSLLVVLVLVRSVTANHGGFNNSMPLDALLPQIFLLQTWFGMGMTWNFPAWTLSGEMSALYMFFVLLLFVKHPIARRVAVAAVAVVAGSVFMTELMTPREEYNVVSVARVITGFFIGVLLQEVWKRHPISNATLATVFQAVAVAALVWTINTRFDGALYFINYAIVGTLIYAFAQDKGALARPLITPPLQWLGKLSFSLYMTHALVRIASDQIFYALERFTGRQFFFPFQLPDGDVRILLSLGSEWANDVVLAVYLVVVVIFAALTFRFVEDPTRTVAAAWSKRIQQGSGPLFPAFAGPRRKPAKAAIAVENLPDPH